MRFICCLTLEFVYHKDINYNDILSSHDPIKQPMHPHRPALPSENQNAKPAALPARVRTVNDWTNLVKIAGELDQNGTKKVADRKSTRLNSSHVAISYA